LAHIFTGIGYTKSDPHLGPHSTSHDDLKHVYHWPYPEQDPGHNGNNGLAYEDLPQAIQQGKFLFFYKRRDLPLNSCQTRCFNHGMHTQARSEPESRHQEVKLLAQFVLNFRHSRRDTIPQPSPTRMFSVSVNLFRFYSIHFNCLTSRSLHIEAQVKNWTSSCYSHFKAPVILVENRVVKYQFICCTYVSIFHFIFAHPISRGHRNPSIVLARKCEEDSTTNLVCHVKSCEGQVVDPSKSIANYTQGSTYNKVELRYLVSHWV
jgi:hypothetical protein